MNSHFMASIRGYVKIQAEGEHLEDLLNLLVARGVAIWDISRVNERFEMFVMIQDFFALRPFLKQTSSRVHVLERHGLPFVLLRLDKRKFFAVGLVCFIIGLYALSSLVWQVHVEGNEKIAAVDVMDAAKKQGIYPFQWKFKLKDASTLSREILKDLPGASWVGVKVEGTQVYIKVVEATHADKPPLMSPRDLMAATDAVVTQIYAEQGKPMVKPNSAVKKGDILISGTIGEGEHQQIVVAKGEVRGLVWYQSSIEVPLVQKYKVYSGSSEERFYLVIGSKALRVDGWGRIPFEQYDTTATRKSLHWRERILPFGWLHETVRASEDVERQLSVEEAAQIGIEQAKSQILSSAEKKGKLINEKILHQKKDSGKVYLDAYFEVEEQIAVEQPIVNQGE